MLHPKNTNIRPNDGDVSTETCYPFKYGVHNCSRRQFYCQNVGNTIYNGMLQYKVGLQIMELLMMQFFHRTVTSSLSVRNTLLCTLFSNTLNVCSSLYVRHQVSFPYKTRVKLCEIWGFHGGEDDDMMFFRAEDADSMILWNVGIYQQVYTAPQPRTTSSQHDYVKPFAP
jgi:hypothetical protein